MSEPPALIRLSSPDSRLVAWIAPDQGAELVGLEWEGRELLHRGRDFSPTTGWTGRAPILWPAIGRTFAPGPEPTAETFKQAPLGWTVDGVAYPMPMHGFARALPWRVDARSETSLSLALTETEATRAFYPFGFRDTLGYAIEGPTLTLRHCIAADPSNPAPMPFALGNHATFDLTGEGPPSDWLLASNATRRMSLDAAGRPDGRTLDHLAFASPAPATDLRTFDVVALRTPNAPPWLRLTAPSGRTITVNHEASQTGWAELQFVTLWGDPPAGYLALEAWLGKPNALASGDGAVLLDPGASLDWTLSISLGEAADTDA